MKNINLDLTDIEMELLEKYAEKEDITVEEFAKLAVFEKIELQIEKDNFEESWNNYVKNPGAYTVEEVVNKLGLEEKNI